MHAARHGEELLTFVPYFMWVSCQTAAFCLGVVAILYLSQKKINPGRRSSCMGLLMKAWTRM